MEIYESTRWRQELRNLDFDIVQKVDVKALLTVCDPSMTITTTREELDMVCDKRGAVFNIDDIEESINLPILPMAQLTTFASEEAQQEFGNMCAVTMDTLRKGAALVSEFGHLHSVSQQEAQDNRETAARTYNYTVD